GLKTQRLLSIRLAAGCEAPACRAVMARRSSRAMPWVLGFALLVLTLKRPEDQTLRHRAVDSAQQFLKPRVGTPPFKPRVDAHKSEPHCMLLFRLSKPAESIVIIAQPTKNN